MRLGQLARKVGVQPSRITTFLEEKNYTLEAGSNSKLTEEQEELIKDYFDYVEEEETALAVDNSESKKETTKAVDTLPTDAVAVGIISQDEEVIREAASSEADDNIEEEATPVADTIDDNKEATPVADTIDNNKETTPAVDNLPSDVKADTITKTEEYEVIRAPKLKLEGLKVVGKLDLPELKTKEEEEDAKASDSNEEISDEVKEKPIRKKLNNYKGNRRPQKQALTLEEKQARKLREKQNRNKRLKEEKKQLKTAYYESKMREMPISHKKNKHRYSEDVEEYTQTQDTTSPAPTTLLGKFMRWLNT